MRGEGEWSVTTKRSPSDDCITKHLIGNGCTHVLRYSSVGFSLDIAVTDDHPGYDHGVNVLGMHTRHIRAHFEESRPS